VGFSGLPARGDRFRVTTVALEPTSSVSGLRGDRDIARQIVGTLASLEERWFDGRR
jgi:hypothetical protein